MEEHEVPFQVGNKHRDIEDGQHKWTLYVTPVNSEDVKYFKSVDVYLHPSFDPSHIKLSTPPFQVKRVGWGTFTIKVKVKFTDGTIKEIEHELSFDSNRTFKTFSATLSIQGAPQRSTTPPCPLDEQADMTPRMMDDDDYNNISPHSADDDAGQDLSGGGRSGGGISGFFSRVFKGGNHNVSPMPARSVPISPSMSESPMPYYPSVPISPTTAHPISPMPVSPMAYPSPSAPISPMPSYPVSPMPAPMSPMAYPNPSAPISPMPSYPISPMPAPISPMAHPISPMPVSPMPVSPMPSGGGMIRQRPPHTIPKKKELPYEVKDQKKNPKKEDDDDNSGPKGNSMSPQHQKPGGDFMSPQHQQPLQPLQHDTPLALKSKEKEEEGKQEREKAAKRESHGKDEEFFKALDTKLYEVDGEQIKFFRENGFVKLRQVASEEEIRLLDVAVDKVMADHAEHTKHPGKMNNLWQLTDDVAIHSLVFSKRLAKVVAELMGVSSVRLYHDQLLMKRNVDKTSWHQDAFYWPFDDQNKVVTAWIPLRKVTERNGALQFAAGTHLDGYISERPAEGEDVDREFFNKYVTDKGFKVHSYDMDVGDISFHTGLCLHTGYPNTSDETRKVMSVIYYADGLRLLEADNKYRELDMKVFWPNAQPGELAASPLHPVVYSL